MKRELSDALKDSQALERMNSRDKRSQGSSLSYPHEPFLNIVFIDFLAHSTKIEVDEYGIRIYTNFFVLETWNANKFYAWLKNGSVTDVLKKKQIYSWRDRQPSPRVMWMVHEIIELVEQERYYLGVSGGL
jgi:hypothetical protein